MNNHSDTITTKHLTISADHSNGLDGYLLILSTPNIFCMDLVGKNLQMNGIDAVWFYPDPVEMPNEPSTLFVKMEQKEQALSTLASLDLIDFTTTNGK